MVDFKKSNTARTARRVFTSVVAAAAVTMALSAGAQSAPGAPAASGMAGGSHHHGMPHGGQPMEMGRMVGHMLHSVNATDAQRAQVHQILQAAAADIKSFGHSAGGDRQQIMALLTAPTVDAAAAESLRQQSMAHQDQVSKRMLAAMIDVSRVLTPEQRAQLAAKMQQRSDWMQKRMQERNASHPAS